MEDRAAATGPAWPLVAGLVRIWRAYHVTRITMLDCLHCGSDSHPTDLCPLTRCRRCQRFDCGPDRCTFRRERY